MRTVIRVKKEMKPLVIFDLSIYRDFNELDLRLQSATQMWVSLYEAEIEVRSQTFRSEGCVSIHNKSLDPADLHELLETTTFRKVVLIKDNLSEIWLQAVTTFDATKFMRNFDLGTILLLQPVKGESLSPDHYDSVRAFLHSKQLDNSEIPQVLRFLFLSLCFFEEDSLQS